jgi:uncharacterized membrane protein YdjX (TVP38/TMEM64 family)
MPVDTDEIRSTGRPAWKRWLPRLIVLCAVSGAALAAYQRYGNRLTRENLAAQEKTFRDYQTQHPVLVYGVAFATYVGVTGLSLPGAVPLTLTCAWLFGFWRSVLLVSFASTTGATVAFLLTRYLFRDAVESRFSERLASFRNALEREGPFFLFTLRLIPAAPFFVINAVMGLTPIRAWTFWWVSQLGMLPGTCVYAYAGSRFPSLRDLAEKGAISVFTWDIWTAFALLAAFPFVARYVLSRIRGVRPGTDS